MLKLIEYIKLHIISLEQDADNIREQMDAIDDLNSQEWQELDIQEVSLNGQIFASRHILSVATDIINDLLTGE